MPRLSPDNVAIAEEIISRYPRPKSAVIPLCHLAQEQDGHLTDEAMAHIAELVGVSSAEVLGTASFYEMLKREEVGRFLVNVCTQLPCMLLGADELLAHAEESLGVHVGQSTPDGLFTLEEAECQAACTEAPCVQVNYRYFHRVDAARLDAILSDLRTTGRTDVPTFSNDSGDIPDHGMLARIPANTSPPIGAGNADPDIGAQPVWMGADHG